MKTLNEFLLLKKLVFIFVLFLFSPLILKAQKFVIPVFPDTQVEVSARPDMLFSQINWLTDNRDSLNIPLILHVGDLVNFDNLDHFETASKAFDIFDNADLPYAIALGNHDTEAVGKHSGSAAPGNVNQNLRKTYKFNSYFPTSRFTMQRGRYEADKSDNAYYTFKEGNLNWLVITLEFCSRQGPVNWASDIISQYDNYNVIIVTHYHLTSKGEIASTNAGYGDFSPQHIFDRMIKKHSNIRFVLSGHVGGSALRVDEGDNGNKIYQILQNYQGEDSGGGYIRLFEFDTDKGTVNAKMYSPFYDQTKTDHSQFTIENINFVPINNPVHAQ